MSHKLHETERFQRQREGADSQEGLASVQAMAAFARSAKNGQAVVLADLSGGI